MSKFAKFTAVAALVGLMSVAAPAQANDWAGWYAGITGGGGTADIDGLDGVDLTGGIVGGHIGYNWQSGSYVWGLEGDMSWSGLDHEESETIGGVTATAFIEQDWLATFRGRIGYSTGPVLLYGTFGLAFAEATIGLEAAGVSVSDSTVLSGFSGGVGLEYAMSRNWSLRGEALWYEVGEDFDLDDSLSGFIGRAGVSYRF